LFTTYKPNETPAVITRSYQAKLTTEPGATLVYGPFQKDLIVKINYN
ncbi:pilus assembly protein, partial [Escherichia coli]